MKEKGQEIQKEEVIGQILFSMSVIVLDMISLIFQSVEGLVFNFPSGTAGLDQFYDIFCCDLKIRDPAIAVSDFAINHEAVFKEIDEVRLRISVDRYVIPTRSGEPDFSDL